MTLFHERICYDIDTHNNNIIIIIHKNKIIVCTFIGHRTVPETVCFVVYVKKYNSFECLVDRFHCSHML